ERFLIEDLHRDAGRGGLLGRGRERGGRQVERRGVDQAAHQVDRLGDHLAAPHRVGVALAGQHGDGQVGGRRRAVLAEAVGAEQRAGRDGFRLSRGGRGGRQGGRLARGGAVAVRARILRRGRPQRGARRPAELFLVEGGAFFRRAAKAHCENERGGELAAARDLGEFLEFAGSAKRGERVGEGTAERLVHSGEAGCGCRAIWGLYD